MDHGSDKILRTAVRDEPAPLGRLWRLRVPFLLPVIGATAGCLLGEFLTPPPMACAIAGLLFLLSAFVAKRPRRATALLVFGIACAFAALHGWRGPDSAAARLARTYPGPTLVEAKGRVLESPRAFGEERWVFALRTEQMVVAGSEVREPFRVQVQWPGPPPMPGDKVMVIGSLSSLTPPRNPGSFDVSAWLARQGLFSQVVAATRSDTRIIEQSEQPSLRAAAKAAREWIRTTLFAGLGPDSPQAHLVVAMTIGEVGPLDPALAEDFRATGTFHLFSVSGLHVGMLAMLLWLALAALRVPPTIAAAIIIPTLFFYALVTGWKPASVRAAVMAAFVLAGVVAGRPAIVINSLFAAAFFILLANTAELFNPGFQLSFVVVLSILVLCPWLDRFFRRQLEVDPFIPRRLYSPRERLHQSLTVHLAPLTAVSSAAWIGSLLLTMGFFHLISLAAIPANMVCVPLAFCIMAVSMLSLVSGIFSQAVAAIFNNTNWALASMLIATVESLAALPGSYLRLPWPELNPPEARVTIFDFGAGGATCLEADGRSWFIDCGPAREHERTVLPYLRQRGVGRLDGLFITHGDAGHMGGASALLDAARPKVVAETVLSDRSPTRKALQTRLEAMGLERRLVQAGDHLPVTKNVSIDVLFPPPGIQAENADDKAAVIRLNIGRWRVLLLSDSGPSTAAWLVANAPTELGCEILVKHNHRSGVAIDTALLDLATPQVVIVAASHFPASARLPAATIDAITSRGIPLLRLDSTGAVTVSFFGKHAELRGFVDHSLVRVDQ